MLQLTQDKTPRLIAIDNWLGSNQSKITGSTLGFRSLSLSMANFDLFKAALPSYYSDECITAICVVVDNEIGWRLRREFGNKVTPALIAWIKNDTPYNTRRKANELGNTVVDPSAITAETDAVKFRGGGIIQLTGRYNYTRYVLPLLRREKGIRSFEDISEPELTAFMNDPAYAMIIMTLYLESRTIGSPKKRPMTAKNIFKAIPYLSNPKQAHILSLGTALDRQAFLSEMIYHERDKALPPFGDDIPIRDNNLRKTDVSGGISLGASNSSIFNNQKQ